MSATLYDLESHYITTTSQGIVSTASGIKIYLNTLPASQDGVMSFDVFGVDGALGSTIEHIRWSATGTDGTGDYILVSGRAIDNTSASTKASGVDVRMIPTAAHHNDLVDEIATKVSATETVALTNKTIGNTNTVTLKDTLFTLQDDGDATKLLAFQLSGITTGNTRTLTVPDASGTLPLTSSKLSVFAATTSAELAGVISDETGSGALVFAASPTFTGTATVAGLLYTLARTTEFNYGSSVSNTTVTWNNGNKQGMTLAVATTTFAFTAPSSHGSFMLKLLQDGTGGRLVVWPTILWAGGVVPTLSTAAGATDIFTFYYNGTSYFGQAALNFA